MDNRLPRSTPEMQGVASSAILEFINAAEQQIDELHSVMLLRHGHVIAEGWWSPYRRELPHMLFSLSKSFTSTAIGLAVDEGRLSVDDTVISFFPDDLPAEVSENLAAMRVHDLLSMATGHAEDTPPKMHEREDGNWVKSFLEQPIVYPPGTHFLYNSGATYMLAAIIQKLTGLTLLDYLQPRLLEPLGIEGATWEVSPQGINTGGWGMKIKTEDIARFGQMYVQKGIWQGKRLLAEAWVEQATSRQIVNGTHEESDWEQGYCYQFWRCRHGAYRGDGAFGQYCIVLPEQDAVLAITSGVSDMQSVLNLVWDCLLPALEAAPLPANTAAHEKLLLKQSSLTLLPPSGRTDSPMAAQVSGRTYRIDANRLNFETVALDFAETHCVFTLTAAGVERRVPFGCGAWAYGLWEKGAGSPLADDSRTAASGVWIDDDTFRLTIRYFETPFYQTLTWHFDGDQLTLGVTVNVAFTPQDETLTARLV